MKALIQIFRRLAALIILLGITGCSDSPNETRIAKSKFEHPGFTANLSGAVNAELSGAGIVTYLGPKERDIVTGSRPGYFLMANLNTDVIGERGLTITFRIPAEAKPGNHNLVTPDPLKVGENFDVRVETFEEGKLIAYQTNTLGTITLDNFSPDRTFPQNSNITGAFQFVTQNNVGGRISANGTFVFPLGRKLVSQDKVNSFLEGSRA